MWRSRAEERRRWYKDPVAEQRVFEDATQQGVIDVNSLNKVLWTYGLNPHQGLQVAKRVADEHGIVPDASTFNIHIRNFVANGQASEAQRILQLMRKNGIKENKDTQRWLDPNLEDSKSNTLRELYLLLGHRDIDGAYVLFHRVVTTKMATVGHFNEMLRYSHSVDCADQFLVQMCDEGFSPNVTTFNNLIALYVYFGSKNRINTVISRMKSLGITPNYVTVLARHGHVPLPHHGSPRNDIQQLSKYDIRWQLKRRETAQAQGNKKLIYKIQNHLGQFGVYLNDRAREWVRKDGLVGQYPE